jgi:hypothetical protein
MRKLRKPMKIVTICNIDKYNSETRLTEEGNNIMRYLFATENGELYMLAFYLDHLHLVAGISNVNVPEANAFMIIEYLGSKLSCPSQVEYLDNGYVYYGSNLGDSMLI